MKRKHRRQAASRARKPPRGRVVRRTCGRPGHGREPARSRRERRPSRPRTAPEDGPGIWLYGIHPVLAALANPHRRCHRLVLTRRDRGQTSARASTPWPRAVRRGLPPRRNRARARRSSACSRAAPSTRASPPRSTGSKTLISRTSAAPPKTRTAPGSWSSTRSPTRTMSAPSCAPPPRSAPPR